jgi:hypothetical protein
VPRLRNDGPLRVFVFGEVLTIQVVPRLLELLRRHAVSALDVLHLHLSRRMSADRLPSPAEEFGEAQRTWTTEEAAPGALAERDCSLPIRLGQ